MANLFHNKNKTGKWALQDSMLFYFACDFCIKSAAKSCLIHDKTVILGTSFDLDPIYVRWLQVGRQDIFRIHCPHPIAGKRTGCYLKGDIKVDLGEPVQKSLHDYERVKIHFQPTLKSKKRLINHFLLSSKDYDEDSGLRRK